MADLHAALTRLHLKPNDELAWEQLFRLTWPFVLALSHRSLSGSRRPAEAEDLAQEVYFKFARYWHERRPIVTDAHGLFSLLAVITRSLALDTRRSQSRGRRDFGRELPLTWEPTDHQDDREEVDLRDFLDRVSVQMNIEQKSIINLRLQGYEVSQIAAQTGASIRTVERKLQRIREILKPFLFPELVSSENDSNSTVAESPLG